MTRLRLMIVLGCTGLVCFMGFLCYSHRATLEEAELSSAKSRAARPTVHIEADAIKYNTETKEVTVSGNVIVSWTSGAMLQKRTNSLNPVVAFSDAATLIASGATVAIKQEDTK